MQYTGAQQRANDYFESSAEYWKSIYAIDGLLPTIYQERHNTTLDWIQNLHLPARARILEIGCGAGLLTAALAQNGYAVDAMDSASAMLRVAHEAAVDRGVEDRIRLHLADVQAMPFSPQAFDLAIAIGVIPWLSSEHLALREMHRVLKPGGYLLATADNEARLNRILDPLSTPVLMPLRASVKGVLRLCGLSRPQSGFQPKRHYPHELHRMLKGAGFKILMSHTLGFGPFTFLGKELLADSAAVRLHRRLQTLVSGKRFSPLRWAGSHHLVLAVKM
jgi:ubiquinone/menaquinone biosynthesis C-methylase UbiE